MRESRLYRIWHDMRSRCKYKNHCKYEYYGGKGVKVCDEWDKYKNFKEWSMTNGYDDSLTIDRIDSNGNYEPQNCRWVTRKEQANNRSSNRYVTYKGETMTLTQLSEKLGIAYHILKARLNNKIPIEEAIEKPVRCHVINIEYNGEIKSITQWSKTTGIPRKQLTKRIMDGWSAEKALTTPPERKRGFH